MDTQLRCSSKLLALMTEDGLVEIKCNSRFCGAQKGVVVLHRFNHEGDLVETLKFKDPGKEEMRNASNDNPHPLRTA